MTDRHRVVVVGGGFGACTRSTGCGAAPVS